MATDIAWVLRNNPKYKDCSWFLSDDQTLENLNWGSAVGEDDNPIPKPTQTELDEYFNNHQTEYNNAVNVGKRIYPKIADQLDDIYHNGIDGWKATIKAIKDANPKESE